MSGARSLGWDTDLDERSLYLRRLVVRGLVGGNRGHIGSSMSLIEVVRVLYDDVLRYRVDEPDWPDRDRFILSKGHGCLALYALLVDKGFVPAAELDRFCAFDGMLGGHPERGKAPGVEASTGALGHGLPIGVGMALAARMQGRDSRVFVAMGDGEVDEGSVWEAALSAAKHRLSNLTAMVDYNKIQSAGAVEDILPLEPLAEKWRSFGFEAVEVNGHDPDSLRAVLMPDRSAASAPLAVICHTVKGKGIPFAEGDPRWHHHSNFAPQVIGDMHAALRGR